MTTRANRLQSTQSALTCALRQKAAERPLPLAIPSAGIVSARLACALMAMGTTVSTPAFSQTAVAPTESNSSESGFSLEEIVITAQKRTEKLSDAPVAASVVDTSSMVSSNIGDVSDLNKLVPSLQLNSSFNNSKVPTAMRGVATYVVTIGIPTGIAFEVDGVPMPSDSSAASQVEDVARVEALKGPQSTLGGRTAAAGVVNYVTRAPTDKWEGSASVTQTDDDERRINGYMSGPLSDRLSFSVSGYTTHREFPIVNEYDNQHSKQDVHGGRAKLLFNVTDNFDIELSGHYQKTLAYGGNYVYAYVTPGAELLFPGSGLTQDILLPGITPSLDNQQVNSPAQGIGANYSQGDGKLNLSWTFGDYSFTSTTFHLKEVQTNKQDLFEVATFFWNDLTGGFAPPFYNNRTQRQTIENTVQEFKFLSPTDGRVNYILGAFYSEDKVFNRGVIDFVPVDQDLRATSKTRTYDAYGRVTFKASDSTSLIGGLRVNHDEINYFVDQVRDATYGPHQSRGKDSSNTLVGDVTGQHKLTSDTMLYATYARGYSPAAYDLAKALNSDEERVPVEATKINHFEIGAKGEWLDRGVRWSTAVWNTVYDDFQINIPQYDGSLAPPDQLVAAGRARTRGIELDSNFVLTGSTTVGLSAAYTDAKFLKFKNATCYGLQTAEEDCVLADLDHDGVLDSPAQDLSGKRMPNAPKFKYLVSIDQGIPLGSLPVDLSIAGSYSYRTGANLLTSQNPYAYQSGFGIANFSLTAAGKSGTWSATVFLNNAFDQHYVVDAVEFWSPVWSATNAVVVQPARDANRYAGIRLTAKF